MEQQSWDVQADVVVGTQRLHVIDVHLETYLDAQQRVLQLRPAVIDAASPVLVSGDFNMGWLQWPASYVPIVSASTASDQSAVIDSYMRALGFDEPTASSGPRSSSSSRTTWPGAGPVAKSCSCCAPCAGR